MSEQASHRQNSLNTSCDKPNSTIPKSESESDTNTESYIDLAKGLVLEAAFFLKSIPFFTRSVFFISLVLLIIKFLSPSTQQLFVLSHTNVFSKYYFWSIITGAFAPSGILNLTVCSLFWIIRAKALEKSLGTLRFIGNFFIDTIMMSILFVLATLLINQEILNGLLAITVCHNTLLCLANREVKISFIFFEIPAKYYPLLLSGTLIIAHYGAFIEVLIGIVYSFLFFYLLKIQIPDGPIISLENKLNCFKVFTSFVFLQSGLSNIIKENAKATPTPKEEACEEKLDKSSDRAHSKKGGSSSGVNYINLEEVK